MMRNVEIKASYLFCLISALSCHRPINIDSITDILEAKNFFFIAMDSIVVKSTLIKVGAGYHDKTKDYYLSLPQHEMLVIPHYFIVDTDTIDTGEHDFIKTIPSQKDDFYVSIFNSRVNFIYAFSLYNSTIFLHNVYYNENSIEITSIVQLQRLSGDYVLPIEKPLSSLSKVDKEKITRFVNFR